MSEVATPLPVTAMSSTRTMAAVTSTTRITRSITLLSSPPSAQPPRRSQSPFSSPSNTTPLPSLNTLIENSHQLAQKASPTSISPTDLAQLTVGIERGFQAARDILDSELKDIRQDIEATTDTQSGKLSRVRKTTKKTITVPKKKQPPAKDGKIKAKVTKLVPPKTNTKSITTLDIYEVPLSQSSPPPAVLEDVLVSRDGSIPQDNSSTSTPPPALDENATVRRIWTPVKNSTVIDLSLDSPDSKPQFSNVVNEFRFASIETNDNSVRLVQEGQPTTKRRCLEVIDLPSVAASLNASRGQAAAVKLDVTTKGKNITKAEKAVKTPRVKKKPRTITDIAMAPYQPIVPEPEPLSTTVQHPNPSGKIVETVVKSTRKPRKSTAKRKEPSPDCILLSPVSAQKTLREQSFVFGTSSQLMTESQNEDLVQLSNGRFNNKLSRCSTSFEDTIEILGLSEDLIVTEKHYEDTPTQRDEVTPEVVDESRNSSLEILGKTESVAKGNLWGVASRGLLGEVLKADMLDMVDDDVSAKEVLDLVDDISAETLISVMKTTHDTTPVQNHDTAAVVLSPKLIAVDIVKTRPTETPIGSVPPADLRPLLCNPPVANTAPISATTSLPTANLSNIEVVPPRLAPVKPKPRGRPTKSQIKELDAYTTVDRPDFETYTLIQLQAQVDKYGFKPMKTRNAMLGLLNRCWDDILKRARVARGEVALVDSVTAAAVEPISAIIQIADDASDDDGSDQPLIDTVAKRKKKSLGVQSKNSTESDEVEVQEVKAKRKYTKKNSGIPSVTIVQDVPTESTDDATMISVAEEALRTSMRVSVEVVSPSKQESRSSTTSTKQEHTTNSILINLPLTTSSSSISVINTGSSSSLILSKPLPQFPSISNQTLAASTTIQLNQRITKFITSQPPSEDLENPSIYQRILMYEPIIIEELASWLWEEGCWGDVVGDDVEDSSSDDDDELPLFFSRGDGEGSEKQQQQQKNGKEKENDKKKKENEGKGKQKQKQKKKKKKKVMVEVDPKIIRTVQEWCEGQSIAWVKRESLGGGSRNRY